MARQDPDPIDLSLGTDYGTSWAQHYKTLCFACWHHLQPTQGWLHTHELLRIHREKDGCSNPCCPVSWVEKIQGRQPRM